MQMSRSSDEQHPVEINTERKQKKQTKTTKKKSHQPSPQLLREAIVTYSCLEGILSPGEYQQLACMIITSRLSGASLF